jgi:uncharacterized lipoprotein YajG
MPKITEFESGMKRSTLSRRLGRVDESVEKPPQRNTNVFRSVVRTPADQRTASKISQVTSSMQMMDLSAPPKLRDNSLMRQAPKMDSESKLRRDE